MYVQTTDNYVFEHPAVYHRRDTLACVHPMIPAVWPFPVPVARASAEDKQLQAQLKRLGPAEG